MMKNRRFLLALVALVLAIPFSISAQPGHRGFGGGHGRGHHGFGGPGDAGPMGSRMMGLMLRGLDLTEAQRQQIDGILEQEQEGGEARREALREAHQSLHALALAETYDASAVKAAAETLGRLMGEMAETRARVGNSIVKVLTDEQRTQLEDRHERMMARRHGRHGR